MITGAGAPAAPIDLKQLALAGSMSYHHRWEAALRKLS
jgi:hypothetical protein